MSRILIAVYCIAAAALILRFVCVSTHNRDD